MSTTPNIGIFIPADGETNYGQSFAQGMVNVDNHDHSGGVNKGLPIGSAGLADFSVTYQKLNANVADTTTGIGVSLTSPNQLVMLGILKNIYQLATAQGILAKNGSAVTARTITGTINQIEVTNGDGSGGNPTIAFPTIVTHTSQPAFSAFININQTVIHDDPPATVQFNGTTFDQSGDYSTGTFEFTCPKTAIYIFNMRLSLDNIAIGNDNLEVFLNIDNSNTVTMVRCDAAATQSSDPGLVVTASTVRRLSAASTVKITISVNGTNITIIGGEFQGISVC